MECLKIALQKSGRLYTDSIELLKDCGIEMNLGKQLNTKSLNFPMEILFLRDDDIPKYIEDGVADVGIVGKNLIFEKKKNINIIEYLGFGRCRLSIAVPENFHYTRLDDLDEKRIATSHPTLLSAFLKKSKIKAHIHHISGSVEIAPNIGISDAVCDLVSSGETLFINNLKEIETILESEAVLTSYPHMKWSKKSIAEILYCRIQAVKRARTNKYLRLNATNDNLEEILSCLSGSPTVLPLNNTKWIAVHALVEERYLWNKIEKLNRLGAKDLLVLPIKKMII